MNKIITIAALTLLCLVMFTKQASAQKPTRLSADISLGIPVTFFTVNSDLVGIYQLGLKYGLSKTLSVSGRVSYYSFQNKTGNPTRLFGKLGPDGLDDISIPSSGLVEAADIKSYKNQFIGLSVYAHYNLHKLLGLEKPNNRFIPYVTAGAGLLMYKLSTVFVNDFQAKFPEYQLKPTMRNYQIGLGAKYFLTPNIDLFAASEFNYVETSYLDGAYADKKNDNFLNTSFGLSYKFVATESRNSIEWTHKNKIAEEKIKKDYCRWSADLNLGLPYLFTPIGYNLTGMGGVALRYSFSSLFSLQAAYHYGQFAGSQDVTPKTAINQQNLIKPAEVKNYSTLLNQLTIRGLFNLRNFKQDPLELRKWNYYGVVGVGLLFYNYENTLADNAKQSFTYNNGTQNLLLGFQARKHLNIKWDFLAGVDFNYNQTLWLDGAPDKSSLNNHLYLNAGISYKIKNKNRRELIDWAYNNYKIVEGMPETEIEKIPVVKQKPKDIPKEMPKVEEVKPIEQPKIEQPKVAEPKVVIEEPKVVVEEPKVVVEEPKVVIDEKPKVIKELVPDVTPKTAPTTEEIGPPPYKYNVIVACFGVNHPKLAFKFRDNMRAKGLEANVYRDSQKSKILKVAAISTNDKTLATQVLRKGKKEIDPLTWLHLYNKQ